MIWIGFPQLTTVERLAGATSWSRDWHWYPPDQAVAAAGLAQAPSRIRLGTVLNRPTYFIQPDDASPWRAVFADRLEPLGPLSHQDAIAIATSFHSRLYATASHQPQVADVEVDQWTLSNILIPQRPFHRVEMGDPDGTHWYVSRQTGEVVRDTRRSERLWNYVGAVTHWIYPTILRRDVDLWRAVVRSLSLAALGIALTGVFLLLRRWNVIWRSFRGVRRIHAIASLLAGTWLITWLSSGFLSFRIHAWFDTGEPTQAQIQTFAGGVLRFPDVQKSMPAILASLPPEADVCEGEWIRFANRPYLWVRERTGRDWLIQASESLPIQALTEIPKQQLVAQAVQLLPNANATSFERLQAPDAHADSSVPTPFRVRFDDAESTWFHIHPTRAQLTERLTTRARRYRWWFQALHTWDPLWLQRHPTLRQFLLVVGLLGGVILVGSGLHLGWRRLDWQSHNKSWRVSRSAAKSPPPNSKRLATGHTPN